MPHQSQPEADLSLMDEISSPDYEFEGFRLDTTLQAIVSPSGEPLLLPSRAFAALRYLIERAGTTVEKSALMAAVWPTTIVAENNLNQCILAARKALGESGSERRFILTVPGRGYKFVAPVTVVPHKRSQTARAKLGANPSRRLGLTVAVGATVVLLVGLAIYPVLGRKQSVTWPAEYEQMTDVTDTATAPVMSPDGRLLAFIRNGSALMGTGQIWLKMLPNGEPVKLTDAHGLIWAPAFTPDNANVVYSATDLHYGNSWDTWTVPVTGGGATKLLTNAQGLTYIGTREVLYSEFITGVHLAVATSLDDRSAHREVYVPSHERGMAHFSHLSPDRKSVLVVEMGPTGAFERCRLAPFDGHTPGYAVGPMDGACLAAAWSVDGKWMFFSNEVRGGSHLWRQRFPNGEAQQITFGPGEERTVFATPDGHALLTSIGITQTTLWLHSGETERALTTEGRVFAPWLSADGSRVYFLTTRGESKYLSLSRMDIDSARQESLVSGFNILNYDVSPDEQQIVFTILRDGVRQIWIAPLDRRTPPKLLIRGADEPKFGGQYVFCRGISEHASYLFRIKTDGSSKSQLLTEPIVDLFAAAPDGKAVVLALPVGESHGDAWVIPIDSASPRRILNKGYSPALWSHDGRALYVGTVVPGYGEPAGSTVVIPAGVDDLPLSELPAASAGGAMIPHSINDLSMGPAQSVYVFLKSEQRQNIYRIPLH